jgi:hypothetical protein
MKIVIYKVNCHICEDRDYLIGAKVTVKAYVADTQCCKHLKDYNKCIGKATCEDKLTNLKDKFTGVHVGLISPLLYLLIGPHAHTTVHYLLCVTFIFALYAI